MVAEPTLPSPAPRRLSARRAALVADQALALFEETAQVHGLTKTCRTALKKAIPFFLKNGRLPRRSAGWHSPFEAQRLEALLRIAAALGADPARPVRLLAVADTGTGLLLEVERGPGAAEGAAAALAAAAEWNALLPRPFEGFRCPGPSPETHFSLPAALPAGTHVLQYLRRQFEYYLARRAGFLANRDIEYVHEMRVALRRIRSVLRLFNRAFRGFPQRIRAGLKSLANLFGRVRDLDVLLAFLRAQLPLLPPSEQDLLAGRIRAFARQRVRELAILRRHLLSEERGRLDAALLDCLSRPMDFPGGIRSRPGGRKAIGPFAVRLLARHFRTLHSTQPLEGRSPEALHGLRIACKRLRYCCECLTPLYPGRLSLLRSKLVRLQDHLGDVNDTEVFAQRLAASAPPGAAPGGLETFEANLRAGRAEALRLAAADWTQFVSEDYQAAVLAEIENRPPPRSATA